MPIRHEFLDELCIGRGLRPGRTLWGQRKEHFGQSLAGTWMVIAEAAASDAARPTFTMEGRTQ